MDNNGVDMLYNIGYELNSNLLHYALYILFEALDSSNCVDVVEAVNLEQQLLYFEGVVQTDKLSLYGMRNGSEKFPTMQAPTEMESVFGADFVYVLQVLCLEADIRESLCRSMMRIDKELHKSVGVAEFTALRDDIDEAEMDVLYACAHDYFGAVTDGSGYNADAEEIADYDAFELREQPELDVRFECDKNHAQKRLFSMATDSCDDDALYLPEFSTVSGSYLLPYADAPNTFVEFEVRAPSPSNRSR